MSPAGNFVDPGGTTLRSEERSVVKACEVEEAGVRSALESAACLVLAIGHDDSLPATTLAPKTA